MGVVLHLMNTLLCASFLSGLFWGRAFLHAIMLINRRGSRRSCLPALRGGAKSRFEAFYGFKADVSLIVCPFGATAYVRLPDIKAADLQSLAYQGLFIGCTKTGWLVYRLSNGTVRHVYHAKFDRDLSHRPALLARRQELCTVLLLS